MNFTPEEAAACSRLVAMALAEDLGDKGDITSQAVIPADVHGRAVFVARSAGVLAGLPAAAQVIAAVDPSLKLEPFLEDSASLTPGTRIAVVSGPMRSLLTAERTALNFLQRLSGVATITQRYVDAVAGTPAKILDTRKTIPGWRLLEKYAVRCGNGHNHRMGLFDGILIKDNHLAGLQATENSITTAIEAVRKAVGNSVPLEIEVDTLDQFNLALDFRPEIILLDNMNLDDLREAVRRREAETDDEKSPDRPEIVLLEAYGGINLTTVRAIAETGVDRISVGALTHSAVALDIALDYEAN
jgi:nicotinate-nucleotide pyrophosphorylase (carboxylating)